MDATTILPETLRIGFYCQHCGGGLLPTKTLAGERSLTCPSCGHEVLWVTRFDSCRVAELEPIDMRVFEDAPLGGGAR